ncbi:metallophosphoesterase [Halobacteriales archaeon SW_12_71_31]|nr:MAG: metallophosphoesterase [Halobacteriales archaeon SW_12_71_31]
MSADAAPPGVAYRARGVHVERADALVVADLHVGRDRTSNVELPMGERAGLTERLGALVERFDPAEVVLAGDVLHAYSSVPDGVETTLSALRGVAGRVDADLVAVRGNHDGLLPSLFEPTHDAYRLADGTLVVHGHERPPEPAPRYVAGHDHPTLEIDGQRRPVCLFGEGALPLSLSLSEQGKSGETTADADGDTDVGGHEYHGDADGAADVLLLPAFSRLAAGVVCNGASARDLQTPLVRDLDRFRPAVYDEGDEETLWFPPLGEFRRLL